MKAIGFRAEPSAINWAVVEGSKGQPELVAASKEKPPATFDEVATLKWLRDVAQHLVRTYSPTIAAVRYAETFQRSPNLKSIGERCRLEGVLIEAMNSCGLRVLTGPLATIAKNLGSKTPKQYLESKELRGLDWSKYDVNRREAILVAASALPEN